MAERKKNAQVQSGVNDDIIELKSLTTLRKRRAGSRLGNICVIRSPAARRLHRSI